MSFHSLLRKTLEDSLPPAEFSWLEQAVVAGQENEHLLQLTFVAVPRYLTKKQVDLSPANRDNYLISAGFSPQSWSVHKLARVFILLYFKPVNEKQYTGSLNTLFETAEINELEALCSSLPLLHYPANWLPHAKDAVRSNMGVVFDSIAFNNPYPSKHFDQAAWNQLVLKTIFGGKSIRGIMGLQGRSNSQLAYMISDLAHERWAAGRPISPQVWELVSPFLDDHLVGDIDRLFRSKDKQNQQAATLSCMHTRYAPAKDLLKKYNVPHTGGPVKWTDL